MAPELIAPGVHAPVAKVPTAQKLLAEDFSTVIFAHGKELRTKAKERLREVIARCRY